MKTFPRLGLGTLRAGSDEQTQEAVRYAIEEAGYRSIDTAAIYGNEVPIGKAINDVISRGVVKREDLWITTKLTETEHNPADVEPACRQSLQKLGLDYVDLYLIHNPYAFKKDEGKQIKIEEISFNKSKDFAVDKSLQVSDTWIAMEKLVGLGLTRHIGVSNFSIELLEKIRCTPGVTMKPYTNQVELHLYMQQAALINYCQSRNIIVTGFCTLGTPKFSSGDTHVVLEDEVLKQVAQEVNRTPAQTELRFLLELGSNVVLLAKSVTPERIKSNISLDFELTEDQVRRLKSRDLCYRFGNRRRLFDIDCYGDEW